MHKLMLFSVPLQDYKYLKLKMDLEVLLLARARDVLRHSHYSVKDIWLNQKRKKKALNFLILVNTVILKANSMRSQA